MLLSKEIWEEINKFAYTLLSDFFFFYKTVSMTFGLKQTTMRAIIHKHWWTAVVNLLKIAALLEYLKSILNTHKKNHIDILKHGCPLFHHIRSESMIQLRERLGKNIIFERVSKYTEALLIFSKKHLDDPQGVWEDILWTDETEK